MKKVTLFFLLFLFFASAKAQKVYFVYLQSENQQGFYARMGEKIYNSSPAGYLIISNLRDSTYTIHIGLQGSQAPDQPFMITVNRKDQGYLLKNFGEKGWGLFNLQSMAVLMPLEAPPSGMQQVKMEKRESNAFTDLLAKASDDSTIKERPVIVKTEEKKVEEAARTAVKTEEAKPDSLTAKGDIADTVKTGVKENISEEKMGVNPSGKKEEKPADTLTEFKKEPEIIKTEIKEIIPPEKNVVVKADTIAGNKQPGVKEIAALPGKKQDSITSGKLEPGQAEEVYKKSIVRLHSESSTTEGIGLTFLDDYGNGKTDTIKILIPKGAKKMVPAETKAEEKKFLDIIPADSVKLETAMPAVVTNNCTQAATEDDFFKLRKKMAGENGDENMIAEAKKVFRTKCFSTQQIRNLGALFLTDEGRYKFFDAAYNFVNDAGNFPSLQSELKEEYFINRFKAMLRY
jgi:hypothetical protein